MYGCGASSFGDDQRLSMGVIGSALAMAERRWIIPQAVGWAGLIFAVYSVNMGAAYRPSARSF